MGKKPEAGRDLRGSSGKSKVVRRDSGEDQGEAKTQAERFIETARAIGVDETGKEFEITLKRIVPKVKTKHRS
jgi:hypothetical protein